MGRGKKSASRKGGRNHPLELKLEVVKAYLAKQAKAEDLAGVYGVSAGSIYEWANAYRKKGEAGLAGLEKGHAALAARDQKRFQFHFLQKFPGRRFERFLVVAHGKARGELQLGLVGRGGGDA